MNKLLVLAMASCFVASSLKGQGTYDQLREKMVEEQLESRDIEQESLLEAMRKVPRHLFIPEEYLPWAYTDRALPIADGQTITQPYVVAYMTQVLQVGPEDKVLEIGTGSGYQAAILGELAREVYTIEIVESLGLEARKRLSNMGYENIEVIIGDGYNGLPAQAPFDAIMVTAGAEELPQPLIDQLADGGRMIIPVGPHGGVRQLTLVTRKNGELKSEKLMAVRFVPFIRQ
ncbi:protein-L-isoaspartate(D-aspartate) O-methyltransferase [Robiginitalea marina]|uniref:Protein-L-isoaspartate O-methyltransferase n=1 Tax=Robiginitalea marina TaxID=2954105 RepID=A0ABT1AU69_9FLAO|nr:protein-L-isoaspartate(D-aspartate) O-methyltransferase [Robiginitalea marina]MCO5723516.1 protein-L-isoaspartate(D-aspartate) O-methyltransferase [Robiginitalea marina]